MEMVNPPTHGTRDLRNPHPVLQMRGTSDHEAEDVTIYFCFHSRSSDLSFEAEWFSITTRGMALRRGGYISPVFKEPDLQWDTVVSIPVSVGPFIFSIHTVEDRDEGVIPSRSVCYYDTRNNDGSWKQAPRLHGETYYYYFFEADDKIYGLGMFDVFSREGLAFDLKCLDCHELDKGWESIYPVCDKSSKRPVKFPILAFKLDYAATTDSATGTIKSHARRALFYTPGLWMSYDFETNAFDVAEVHQPGLLLYCDAVGFGDMLYFLSGDDIDETLFLMAYHDPFVQRGAPTRVLGLEKFDNALPVGKLHDGLMVYPPAKMLLVGEEGGLCIIWADICNHIGTNKIYCTKFNINVKKGGKLHAVNVTTLVYKVKGSHKFDFDAVVSDGKMISRFLEGENEKRRGVRPSVIRCRNLRPRNPCQQAKIMRRFKIKDLSMLIV